MNLTAAILYSLIGAYHEIDHATVSHPSLGSAQFTTFANDKTQCVVRIVELGGEVDSILTITPSVKENINQRYIGMGENGPVRRNYLPFHMTKHEGDPFGDFIMLNRSSEFTLHYQSIDKLITDTQKVSCDAKLCSCINNLF